MPGPASSPCFHALIGEFVTLIVISPDHRPHDEAALGTDLDEHLLGGKEEDTGGAAIPLPETPTAEHERLGSSVSDNDAKANRSGIRTFDVAGRENDIVVLPKAECGKLTFVFVAWLRSADKDHVGIAAVLIRGHHLLPDGNCHVVDVDGIKRNAHVDAFQHWRGATNDGTPVPIFSFLDAYQSIDFLKAARLTSMRAEFLVFAGGAICHLLTMSASGDDLLGLRAELAIWVDTGKVGGGDVASQKPAKVA